MLYTGFSPTTRVLLGNIIHRVVSFSPISQDRDFVHATNKSFIEKLHIIGVFFLLFEDIVYYKFKVSLSLMWLAV